MAWPSRRMTWVTHTVRSVHAYLPSALSGRTALQRWRPSNKIILTACFATFRSPFTATASSINKSVGLHSADCVTIITHCGSQIRAHTSKKPDFSHGFPVRHVAGKSHPQFPRSSSKSPRSGSRWASPAASWLLCRRAHLQAESSDHQFCHRTPWSRRESHSGSDRESRCRWGRHFLSEKWNQIWNGKIREKRTKWEKRERKGGERKVETKEMIDESNWQNWQKKDHRKDNIAENE